VSVEKAADDEGQAEVPESAAVADTADAELENSEEVLEEAESTRAAEAEDALENAGNESLAETEAEEASETLAELAVENAPVAGDETELELDEIDNEEPDEKAGA
jgi:hypothetical protein